MDSGYLTIDVLPTYVVLSDQKKNPSQHHASSSLKCNIHPRSCFKIKYLYSACLQYAVFVFQIRMMGGHFPKMVS